MKTQFKYNGKKQDTRKRKADTGMNFVLNVLLPDFLICVVGTYAGISLMLYLFQL